MIKKQSSLQELAKILHAAKYKSAGRLRQQLYNEAMCEAIMYVQQQFPAEQQLLSDAYDAGVKYQDMQNGAYYDAPDKEMFLNQYKP